MRYSSIVSTATSVTALWIGTCFWSSSVSGHVRPGLWSVASLPVLQLCSTLPRLKVHRLPKLQDLALLLPRLTGKGNRCGGNLIRSSSYHATWIILQWSDTSSSFLMTGISRICDEGIFLFFLGITVKQPLLKNILILDKIDLSLLFGLQYRFQTTAGGWDCIGQVRQHSATCNLL